MQPRQPVKLNWYKVAIVPICLLLTAGCSNLNTTQKQTPSYQNSILAFAQKIKYNKIKGLTTYVKPIPHCSNESITCVLPGALQNFQSYNSWANACQGYQNLAQFLNLSNFHYTSQTYQLDPRKLYLVPGEPLIPSSNQVELFCLNQPAPYLYFSGDISNTGNLPIYVVGQLHHLPEGLLQLQLNFYNKNRVVTKS